MNPPAEKSAGGFTMRSVLRWMLTLCLLAGCLAGLHFWLQEYQKPLVRSEIEEPLFTVADAEYSKALQEGRQVIRYGPLPGSAFYAGSLAFQQPEEALAWLKSTGYWDKGWRVFELTGDFLKDTHLIRGLAHTNKTLLISREVPVH